MAAAPATAPAGRCAAAAEGGRLQSCSGIPGATGPRARHALEAIVLALLVWFLVAAPAAAERRVLAVNIGWHVGLAFTVEDLDPAAFPEITDFPDARWIEVGWGDAGFYRNPDPGLGAMLDAAFASKAAVLHLVAMPAEPARYLPKAEVLTIRLDDARFARLVAHIAGEVDRGGQPRAAALGPGLYPVSRFYPAFGRFSLDRTCNTWTAQALAAAGVAVDPDGVARASTLMSRIRKLPEVTPAPPSDRR